VTPEIGQVWVNRASGATYWIDGVTDREGVFTARVLVSGDVVAVGERWCVRPGPSWRLLAAPLWGTWDSGNAKRGQG
jgi:hypothetical protein